jgi:alpha-beta hydrolase superfamily lysophospholipase
MAEKKEYTFDSADGVSKIHCVKWLPEQEPVAVLQIVHGMVEYIERYTPFAEFLVSKGFVVVGHDHIGHGASVSSPEELGVMHAKHPSDIMVEDIYKHYTLTKADYGDIPYFILGHSMGSYMTRKTLCVKAKEMDGLSGAIIMGTGTEAPATIKAGLAVINLMALFRSDNYRSTMVRDLTYSAPYKQYDVTGATPENSWLTKDVEIVKKYYKDPKCTYLFTLGAYRGLVESTDYDNNDANIAKMKKDLPIFFVSGAADPVGNMGQGVQAAYDKFKNAGMQDLSIKLYENDRHEILNELDKDVVYADLLQWMQEKMA